MTTYRDFLNNMSNEELAETINNDTILHMACNGSVDKLNLKCPYKEMNCVKCIKRLLDSDMDNTEEMAKIEEN